MSDSDDDLLPNNVFTFQNDNTTISARGPNINNTNITGLSFRNNVLTSTMHMPVNFERQRYGGSNIDQRSLSYRRETSPMSLRSVPDYGPPPYSRSTFHNRIGSQRSMYNGRGGSPVSIRSIDSTASVSAADIVFAFKNVKFNKYDLRIIKDAYNKLLKTRQRKRIEKRRNLKLFLKGTRRKSGEDSGEQGSDSSISSDDCRSVRTTICKENIPGLKQMRDLPHFKTNMRGHISSMADANQFTTNAQEIPMFMDRTENIKQNTLRNIMTVSSSVSNFSTNDRFLKGPQIHKPSPVKAQNTSVMSQKERFKKGFLLPSQRFNKTSAGQKEINTDTNIGTVKKSMKNQVNTRKPSTSESGSDKEEIFYGFSSNHKDADNSQRKRSLDSEDFCQSNKKRNKLDSPNKAQSSDSKHDNIVKGKSNDFIFVKPKMPIKKGGNMKKHFPEKMLAKSHVPPIEEEIDFNFVQNNNKPIEKENVKGIDEQPEVTQSCSDVSMRPSFIKRKLFTQKLDVAEHKNASCDSIGVNSPQNIYSDSVRERNKARKLVTSQSCLSREVPGEDNNVLDLIHKIVPPDQINITNVTNKTDICNDKSNNVDNSEKWDVTAVIANCDNQDISDTYTDEEIFHVNHEKKPKEPKKPTQDTKKLQQCKIMVQKLPQQVFTKGLKNYNNNMQIKSTTTDTSKKSVTDCVKSFWDTDFESDMEFNVASTRKNNRQQNQEVVHHANNKNYVGNKQKESNKKAPNPKGTILTVRNCHQSILNSSLKSRRSPISSDKKGVEHSNSDPVVEEKDNIAKKNKNTNSKSQTGKKNHTVKENITVNKKNERKPKAKQCTDCNENKPIDTKKLIKNTKLTKHNNSLDNKKHIKSSSKNENLPVKATLKSKDYNRSTAKLFDKDTTNNVMKSGQKNNTRAKKESVPNGRTQPKRKSKDKSFIQSSTQKTITDYCTPNKTPRKKLTTELAPKNISINNVSTMMTRSREKSFNSSQGDFSSMNLSNISNRSLRLRQRVQRNIN